MAKSLSLKIVVLLALAQGIAGLLRAFNWLMLALTFLARDFCFCHFSG